MPNDPEDHAARLMAAAARAYGGDVLAPATPAGADETLAAGCRLFRLMFGGRAVEDDLSRLLAAAGAGVFAPRLTARDDSGDEDPDPLERRLCDFISGALIGLDELRPQVLAAVAAFYRRTSATGDGRAYADLGDVLRHDDFDGALEAYERAVAGGDTHSLISLGELLSEHADAEGAECYLRQAVAAGDPDLAAQALFRLADIFEESDPAAAEAALAQAIEQRPASAPRAMVTLGHRRSERGDHAGARAAFQVAIDSGQPGWATDASESLAMMLEEQGDLAGAKAAYERAAMADDGHWRFSAFMGLLSVLRKEDDLDGVRALGQAMAQAGRDRAAAESLEAIGQLLEERSDIEGARDAYRQAADAGDDFAELRLERLSPSAEPAPDADAEELPVQFDPRNILRTGAEVLEHGLPPLPHVLSYRMAIPVAYWTAQQCAVVLFLRFNNAGKQHHPVGMKVTFEKGAEGWTAHRHSVGSRFSHDPIASPGDRRHLAGRRMCTGGGFTATRRIEGHPAAVRTGSASPTVKYIALIQDGREDRRRLDSHFGAWVVCTESLSPIQVAGYDENGIVLARVG
jgi:tetratricopeptide (TPR) repeat protein